MDIAVADNQTISDDQELAKALAGVTQEADGMTFEETGGVSGAAVPADNAPADHDLPSIAVPDPTSPVAVPDPVVAPPVAVNDTQQVDPGLSSIKQTALTELRPLIDKLDVSPEEKFNTYLLLIRSTDDQDLIAPAHEAARAIVDESKRAQALLDIIREIDYLSNPQPQQ